MSAMSKDRRITMPPLRPYELADLPAKPLAIPPETDTFVILGEHETAEELQSRPRPVILPPLRSGEIPDTAVSVLAAVPDRVLDEPEWGTAKRVPEITLKKERLLRPWDEEK